MAPFLSGLGALETSLDDARRFFPPVFLQPRRRSRLAIPLSARSTPVALRQQFLLSKRVLGAAPLPRSQRRRRHRLCLGAKRRPHSCSIEQPLPGGDDPFAQHQPKENGRRRLAPAPSGGGPQPASE